MLPVGCAIEDAVSDEGVVEFVDRYIRAVHLRSLTGLDSAQSTDLKALGLLDDPETLYELEQIVHEAIEKRKPKS
jgi:hypothetical protein